MKLTSTSFKDGDYLGADHILSADYGFGCGGGNRSPHLRWEDVPAGTKSFAVTCFDPDAPTGSGFWHWVVVNIPADVTGLALGAGNPQGDHPHRYLFTVHAVSMDSLPVTADTSAAVVGFYLNFNTLAKASLMGLFKR